MNVLYWEVVDLTQVLDYLQDLALNVESTRTRLRRLDSTANSSVVGLKVLLQLH